MFDLTTFRRIRLSTSWAGGAGTLSWIGGLILAAIHAPYWMVGIFLVAAGFLLGIGYWRLWTAAKGA